MKIIKRNGSEEEFRLEKILAAVTKANRTVPEHLQMNEKIIEKIGQNVLRKCEGFSRAISVEEIQDMVENEIMNQEFFEIARNYITYRYKRTLARKANSTDNQILSLIDCNNEEVKQENSNKNPTVASVQRDYVAGEVSKDLARRILLPEDIIAAHDAGIIHMHDLDYYMQRIFNCCLINLKEMLEYGTVISETMIEPPKSFATACNVATQIIAQVASNQYGGQTITLSHLAPFIQVSREKYRNKISSEFKEMSPEVQEHLVEYMVKEEIKRGIQMIQYQVITLMTTNGQAPFITVFMYLNEVEDPQTKADLAAMIEEMLKQRIQGVKNEKGVWITPAFPKLIYVLDEDNITEDAPYWYLTQLAATCTAKRMVPDYISAKMMKELKLSKGEEAGHGDVYPCMGCRSFLTPDRSGNGFDNMAGSLSYEKRPKYYGRFNQGVVTINLVDVACSSKKDRNKFWEILEERLELCHRALRCRHERLKGTSSDISPIHWQYGALARLKKGETIDKLLYNGYSTISLGYAGLYECVKYMTGYSHTDSNATQFALDVMQKLNDKCTEWKEAENIDYSVYGTPLESTTYKFAKKLQERFGVIEGITDRNYITNSYHVPVFEEINAFEKLEFESKLQNLSPGGAISYIEVPNMQDNIPAVLAVLQFIYDHIMYAELNTKSDYCQKCGYDGEIKIIEEDGKLLWECPNCGNRDENTMNVARRTCGYIGTQFWNQGRTQEIKERVLHL